MFIYRFYDLFRRTWYRDVQLVNVSFNDPVAATDDATLTATLPVGDDVDPDLLRLYDQILIKERTWCLVVDPQTNKIIWHGVLMKRPWSIKNQSFALTFNHMRWWFTQRYLGYAKTQVKYTAQDRLKLARTLVGLMQNDRSGDPRMTFNAGTSGQLVDYLIEARSFKTVAECLNEIGAGAKGFEWDVLARWGADDKPEMNFATFYPELRYTQRIALKYDRDGTGNILTMPDEWPDDATNAVSRVWALGSGTDQAQVVSSDTDPAVLAKNGTGLQYTRLLREKVITLDTTNDAKTLSAAARAERIAMGGNSATVDVGVGIENPDFSLYGKGARARLVIKDRFLNVDLPYVRVIDVRVDDETRDKLATVTLTLDLEDSVLPDGMPAATGWATASLPASLWVKAVG